MEGLPMLVKTDLSIAFKDALGQYNLNDINIFKMDDLNGKLTGVNIKYYNSREVLIRIKCPICNNYHYYCYDINDLLNREMIIGGCEEYGVPVFYVGKDVSVKHAVNNYRKVTNFIYAMI